MHTQNKLSQANTLINPSSNPVDKFQQAFQLHQQGQLEQAEVLYEALLKEHPKHINALHFSGVLANQRGDAQRAVDLIRLALDIDPHNAAAHSNLGLALQALKRFDDALASYDHALRIKPSNAEAHYNRGNALLALKQPEEAILSFDRALNIKNDYIEALSNRGIVLKDIKRYDEALDSYNRALAIQPNCAEALVGCGVILQDLKRFDDALISYDRALAIKPDLDFILGIRLHTKMNFCNWTDFDHHLNELTKAIERDEKVAIPFTVQAISSSAALQKKAAEIYTKERHPSNFLLPPLVKHTHSKIKIGYFSSDFRDHAVSYLTAELLECHDRSRFEIIAFSFYPTSYKDDMRLRLEAAFDQFIDVSEQSDEQVAHLARQREIDIAVDLKGFTEGCRTGIFALRVAPIQVNYLGYPSTMGADYIDYLLADSVLIPTEYQRYYSEKIAYLPNSYQVNDTARRIADKLFTRAELGLPEQGFVFCCFNNNYKITPVVFAVWMRLLHKIEGSVLWLLEDNAIAATNLRREATARGINAARLIFAKRMALPEHLARHRLADLFLDTLPYNAHTTTSDALWAGLPVLTCVGEAFASRVAASLLNAIGLPELITTNHDDYEALAIQLATHPEQLAVIKQTLADNRLTYPLFNTELFTQHIESAYQAMFDRYQAGLAPDHIYVSAQDTAAQLPPVQQSKLSPTDIATFQQAFALHQQGQLEQAEVLYAALLKEQPHYIDALHFSGVLAKQRGYAQQGVSLIKLALEIDPHNAAAHSNLGLALQALERFDEALISYDHSLAIRPDNGETYYNRGNTLLAIHRYEKAIASYERALTIQPDHAYAHWGSSWCYLILGNFDKGWKKYEWRWKTDDSKKHVRHFSKPLWLGEVSLRGKTIFLYCEQGLGDALQFCRYAKQVAALGARVILEVPVPLLHLLTNLEGVDVLIAQGSVLPAFDFCCPLLSLPLAFKTRLESIPANNPYLFSNPNKVKYWQALLGEKTKPRIGLVWSGNAAHKNDEYRSLALHELLPLLSLDYQFISLQKELRATDKDTLAQQPLLQHYGEHISDFSDTAALCELMDIVISVDTSVAHLAAAMGKPTWILLPYNNLDWRWLLNRNDSPWYSTARLFRQNQHDNWQDVIERLQGELIDRSVQTPITKLLPVDSDLVETLINDGNDLEDLNDLEAALACYDHALSLDANYARAHSNRGNVLQSLQRYDEALASYDCALATRPEYAEAFYNRGNALQALHRIDEALVSYTHALAIKPDFVIAMVARGMGLQHLNRFAEALADYDRVLAIQPDYVDILVNRGSVLQNLSRYEEMLVNCDQLLAIQPDSVETLINRGNVLQILNRFDQAISSYDAALAINPDHQFLLGTWFHNKMRLCDWLDFDNNLNQLTTKITQGKKISTPFPVLALTSSAAIQQKVARYYVQEKYPSHFLLPPLVKHRHEKIKIAYFSADFRVHVTAQLIAELFDHHDRSRFEIIAFSFYPTSYKDDMRLQLEAAFDQFIDVSEQSDEHVAHLARQLEIDIAVDLKGFTEGGRTGIFALRVAPIQVNYLGYPSTMGADYIDYLLADSVLIPTEYQRYYSEKIVYLPNSYQVNDTARRIADKLFTRAELGLPEQGFVFCCFNNNYKITPVVFAVWMRLLHKIEGSVLWLLEDNAIAATNLRREATARGINVARLIFAKRMALPEHLARHRLADLFLDTLPCNAHTTTSDALWAGLPVLTCVGEAFASRVAASLLNAIGLPELITTNHDDYEALAIQLATHPEQLAVIKQTLADNRLTYPLFNTKLFTQHIESAYQAMFDRYQAGLAPDYLYVSEQDTAAQLPPAIDSQQHRQTTPVDTDKFQQALSLHQQGELSVAEMLYKDILHIEPQHVDVLHFLGVLKNQIGQPQQAVDLIQQAIDLYPNNAAAYSNIGLAFQALERFDDALASYDCSLTISPNDTEALFRRGNLLLTHQHFDQALASYDDALTINPSHLEVLCNRGLALQGLKRFDDAIANDERALAIKPDYAEALINRGNALNNLRRFDDALGSYDRALVIAPNDAETLTNRGNVLRELKRFDDALASYDLTLTITPNNAEVLSSRGIALQALNRWDEALASYERALTLNPHLAFLLGTWLSLKMKLCDWREFDDSMNTLSQKITQEEKAIEPFAVQAISLSGALQKKAAEIYTNAQYPSHFLAPALIKHQHQKIRIGYFSSDFRQNHPVAYLTAELFECHDRSRFEIIAFSFSPVRDKDDMRLRLEAAFDQFIDVSQQLDEQVVQLARRLEIDIAINLNGFTAHARTELFAMRAAPIQVSYIGYLGTMGADYMDYLLADATLIPKEHQIHYSEKVAYLPHSFQVNDSKLGISSKHFTRTELGLPEQGFVFCCFNANFKITPVVFDSWMRLLHQVEGSVLWLLEENTVAATNLRREAIARGISAERLVFAQRLPMPEYLARHRVADLFLDTAPYNAGATASAALWAGLPVLTCLGDTFSSRMAASLLYAIGLPELVTKTPADYEALAVKLATHPKQLAIIKQKLADNRLIYPLFNTTLFTQHLESAYQAMFDRYQADLAPDHIYVPAQDSTAKLSPVRQSKVSSTDIATFQQAFALHQQGQLDQAEALYKNVVQHQPHHADALHLLGVIAKQRGQAQLAVDFISQSLTINPDNAAAQSNIGLAFQELNRFDDALVSYDRALTIEPDYAEALFNRGITLQSLKRLDEALVSYDRALILQPDYAETLFNRGVVLQELKRLDEALDSYNRALAIQPDYAAALFNRGNVLGTLKRFEEAIVSYHRALAIKPDLEFLYGTWLHTKMNVCDWRDFEQTVNQLNKEIVQGKTVCTPFVLQAISSSAALLKKVAGSYTNTKYPAAFLLPALKKHAHSTIKIGYFSSDFRHHPVAHLTAELFERHDRSRFEVIAFSFHAASHKDDMRLKLETVFDQFIDVSQQSDEQIVQLARELEIDIAVDLNGFTEGGRTHIFAMRAAPIQVSYIGYLGTMGADYMDYLLADATLIPKEHQIHYSEKVAYLPHSFQVNDSKLGISSKHFTRTELGLPEQGFVFCCFNANFKITPVVFDSWMRLLHQVEGSVLWLLEENTVAATNLRREAIARGISAERLVFAQRLPMPEYLARHRVADLFLDTAPYNAGATASAALWAGLPVLTCLGDTFSSRMAASLLYAIGLPELVTKTPADYEALAVKLATHPKQLAIIKQKLADNRLIYPLFNTTLFTQHLESAYQAMFDRYQADLAPDHIYVSALASDMTDTTVVEKLSVFAKIARKPTQLFAGIIAFNRRKNKPVKAVAAPADIAKFTQAQQFHQLGQLEIAAILYEELLTTQPDHTEAQRCLQAIKKSQAPKVEAHNAYPLEAQNVHEIAPRLDSNAETEAAEALINEGNALEDLHHLDAALASYDRALSINPNSARAHSNRGNVLQLLTRYDEALTSYDHALAIRPDYAEACYNRGNALYACERFQEAIDSYDRALAMKPDFVEALIGRGNALHDDQRFAEALTSYDRVLHIKSDNAEVLYNRGNVLQDLDSHDEALASYDRALTLRPDYVEALYNQGRLLQGIKRYDEALAIYNRALTFNPDNAKVHWNSSLCYLLLGNFDTGWAEYEWRWQTEDSKHHLRHFAQPQWFGEASLRGKTILLHCEQGLGDTLQFCRYAKRVADLGARVILEVQAPLVGLLTHLEGVEQLIAKGSLLPVFDFHSPLLSLPLAFKTRLESIPADNPYVFSAPDKVKHWQALLGEKNLPRVGVVWSGNSAYRNDHNRSLTLHELLPLLTPRYQFISLQKELRDTDRELLTQQRLHHYGEQISDFTDTAALCELMDIIISVDTSVAHLAAAMGKPTWILLPYNPDWRWLLNRDDSPWYPTARLFRQSQHGDWQGVVERVTHELIDRLHTALPATSNQLETDLDAVDALINQGNEWEDINRLDDALASYDRAVSLNPNYARAHSNRGNVLQSLNRFDEALASYDRALAIRPDYAEAFFNRGNALQALARLNEALASYDCALAIKPDFVVAIVGRGTVLQDLKRFDEALASYDSALAIKPDYIEALSNRGVVLQEMKRFVEALLSYDHVLAIKPDALEIIARRGMILQVLNRFDEAINNCEQALAINPDMEFMFGTWLHIKMKACDWRDFNQNLNKLTAKITQGEKVCTPFAVHALSYSAAVQQKAAAIYTDAKYPNPILLPAIAKHAHSKIKIGYFSSDFRNHPVAYLMMELLERHDRLRFEVIGFSFHAANQKDETRLRLETVFDQFIDVSQQSDEQVVRLAREREIDIAIDLNGFTDGCRATLFAQRVAPIQVSYLGYLGTMGTDYMDYLLADLMLIPKTHQAYYNEKIAYLPHSFQVNDSTQVIADKIFTRAALNLPEQGFVFCCFNNNFKITPTVFDVWMRILHQVDGSVLWLLGDNESAIRNLKIEATARGIAAERLIFAKRLAMPDYLARHRVADLFLDTSPYNAGATASSALWAGLPVLTYLGDTFAGRMAASLLDAIGLPELITDSLESYEALAVTLATQPEQLAVIKQTLANNRLTYPLFNTALFTQHIESAFQTMFDRYQAGLAPDYIYVSAQNDTATPQPMPQSQPSLTDINNFQQALSLHQQGQVAAAEILYEQVLQAQPEHVDALHFLGVLKHQTGQPQRAVELIQQSIDLYPNNAAAHSNLAMVLHALHRFDDALTSYDKALTLTPDDTTMLFNQAQLLQGLNRTDDAIASYQHALTINPKMVEVHNNLATLFKKQERYAEAEASYQRAISIKPDYSEAHCNLITLIKDQGQRLKAETLLNTALIAIPDSLELRFIQLILTLPIVSTTIAASASAPSQFDAALTDLSHWLASSIAHQDSLAKAGLLPLPFLLAYRIGNHVQRLSRYGDLVANTTPRVMATKSAHTKIRMIVVSHHFRRHSVWDVITRGLLANLDRSRFELILYHLGNAEDQETAFAKSLADTWRDTHSVTDVNQWLTVIETDAPDVIFYPEIGMDPMSARLASHRLAPLQMASWGHPITTGFPTIDLYFSGELLEAADADSHYRERLIRLPSTGCCTTPIQITAEPLLPELDAQLATRKGARFIIAQTIYKFDPLDDGLFADIANIVGDCTFILLRDRNDEWAMDQIVARLEQTFIDRGLNPKQHLLIIPWQTMGKFQRLLELCDVYLDCPAFSGYTTAWQAVQRGIPIVTLEGEFMRQRLAAGLLRKIGITDTIASSRADYVQLAAKLAKECANPIHRAARRNAIKTAAPKADNDVSVVRSFEQSVIDALAERGISKLG